MAGWDRIISRYRRLNGFTQSAFGQMLGVEQATVSRWERGYHTPDLAMQKRLRAMIGRDVIVSDDVVIHRVRQSFSAVKMATRGGRNVAVSRRAAMLHGVGVAALEGIEYRRFYTEILGAQWEIARKCGFFKGDVASIHVFNTWVPVSGGAVRYCEGLWTPVFLSGGEIMLASEFADIDEAAYRGVPESGRFSVVTLDDLLQ